MNSGSLSLISDWKLLELPTFDALPAPVFLRSLNLEPQQGFPLHSHRWHQFVYAVSGTLVVTVLDSWYVITPEQGIWIPAGVRHTTGTLHGAESRSLYVELNAAPEMPDICTVFAVTPLLRELIVELGRANQHGEAETYRDLLNRCICEQISRLQAEPFRLPWPQSVLLQRICEALYEHPDDRRSLAEWGRVLGASPRTLTRRFEKETGISLREWRRRLRLFLAMEWLCAGTSVTEVALKLGYASTAAFTYMFRREVGSPPSEWRER